MRFCSNCFQDAELKAIIDKIDKEGTRSECPICGSKNVYIYNTEKDSSLIGIFDNLLSVYTAECDLPSSFPKDDLHSLLYSIKNDWDIFSNIPDDCISEIIKSLSPTISLDYPMLFSGLVGIPEKYDLSYLKENSILKTEKWDDFVDSIKHKNRFHTDLINKPLLKNYCLNIIKEIPIGKHRFYRGRISTNRDGFPPSEMGAPQKGQASDGRANSAGISRLYLTDNIRTTFHEIRAAEYDYVTIGTFKQQKPIKVVDLKRIHKISPFGEDVDCTALAINREHLIRINQEMSRTMRKGDGPLDYLSTQYICDFVMSITDQHGQAIFDGIEYQSTMDNKGSNFAIFNPDNFKCTYSRTYEVKKLIYSTELIAKHKI